MPAREDLCENIQPTKFFARSGYIAGELSKAEAEVLKVIGEEPVSVFEISALTRKDFHPQTLDCLIKKRLVQVIGFTPTDALHVLGNTQPGVKKLRVQEQKGLEDSCA